MGAVIFLLIIVALVAIAQYGRRKAIEAKRAKLLAWAQPLVKDQLFIAVDANSLIGFDFEKKLIFLANDQASGKYRFDEIASCELLRDHVSLTQTNRGSQLLGAAVGEVLLGPAGAVLGALSGSKRSTTRLAKLELKLVVDCQRNPVYRVALFTSQNKKGASSSDPRLRPALALADRYHGHVVNAIRNSDREQRSALASGPHQVTEVRSSSALIDLRELFELKKIGAISEAEYEAIKGKTLGVHHIVAKDLPSDQSPALTSGGE